METVLLLLHLLVAVALIGVVLLQRSEGGALGIGGGGGSGSLFSSRGVGNYLTRTTAYLAVAFFATSIALTILATKRAGQGSVFDQQPAQTESAVPAAPAAPAAPEAPKVPQVPVNP